MEEWIRFARSEDATERSCSASCLSVAEDDEDADDAESMEVERVQKKEKGDKNKHDDLAVSYRFCAPPHRASTVVWHDSKYQIA